MDKSVHVPAWKRLGIKLKRQGALEPSEPEQKKQKLHQETATSGPNFFGRSPDTETEKGNLHGPRSGSTQRPISNEKRRSLPQNGAKLEREGSDGASVRERLSPTSAPLSKRVSFTADTKLSDPDVGLVWPEELENKEQSTPSSLKAAKMEKKKQRRVSEDLDPSAASAVDAGSLNDLNSNTVLPPYLQYLETFYNHRQSWKFNKHHQTRILQNIFDLDRIPLCYDAALCNYVEGLQGETARSRLHTEAESMSKSEGKRTRRSHAPDSAIELVDSQPETFSETDGGNEFRLNRANAILKILAAHSIAHELPFRGSDNGISGKPRRSRGSRGKRNTELCDESSASSDSEAQ